jgi:hypothetical protein
VGRLKKCGFDLPSNELEAVAQNIQCAPTLQRSSQGVENSIFEPWAVLLAEVSPDGRLRVLHERAEVLGPKCELAVEVDRVSLGPAARAEQVRFDRLLEGALGVDGH